MAERYREIPDKRRKQRRRQLFIARAKIITILILFIFIIVFMCSLALGVFSKKEDLKNDEIEASITNQTSINSKDNEKTIDISSLPSSKISKTQDEKLAELEGNYSFEQYNKNCDWSMLIVNAHNPHSVNYTVETEKYNDFNVDVRIESQLSAMIEASRNAGVDLWLSSSYRTTDTQTYLYENETEYYTDMGYSEIQAKELAKKSVAVPGTSEHEIGLAVDFNNVSEEFKYTPEYAWLCDHAFEYGFIQRYPEGKEKITDIIFEPWHYRYVGRENAVKINESGMCLEEYVYDLINK